MRSSALLHHEAGARAQELREQLGLIETALAFPRGVQRDRNDKVEPATAQARIVERFDQPIGDGMAQMNLMPVLEVEQDLAHHAAAAIGRDGGGRNADGGGRNWRRRTFR